MRKVFLYSGLVLILYFFIRLKILLKKLLHFNKRTDIFIFVVTRDNARNKKENNF